MFYSSLLIVALYIGFIHNINTAIGPNAEH